LFFYSFKHFLKVSISSLQLSLLKSYKSKSFGESLNISFIFLSFSTNLSVFNLAL